MSEGRVYTAEAPYPGRELACDVCVVGSGAGGGMLARELVEQGRSVVLLEEGPYVTARDFELSEATAYPTLYQELGNRSTDDLAITVLQGRNVGGGTTVNWCTCFRTPPEVLAHWHDVFGVEGLSAEVLAPHFERVEQRLSVVEWPEERMNGNNRALWNGLGKLGYARASLRRNVKGCLDLGFCGLGCPAAAKQSVGVALLPEALERGLTVLADTFGRRVLTEGRRASVVEAQIRGRAEPLSIRAKAVAVCGGAINSPAFLLRSGLAAGGRVGRRTWLHPVAAMVALFEERIDGFAGAPQSAYSPQFRDRGRGKIGFVLETPPIHPLLAAVTLPGHGEAHGRLLERLAHVQALLAITHDGLLPEEEGGTVRLRSDSERRVHLDYPLLPAHWEAFRFACREMARVQLAAGAREVRSLHDPQVVMRSEADLGLLEGAPWERLRMRILTAHQMGGCAMGRDPARSVVDSTLRFHTLDNLFVVDGSVFPTGLGVNPQETVFALASWAAPRVAALA